MSETEPSSAHTGERPRERISERVGVEEEIGGGEVGECAAFAVAPCSPARERSGGYGANVTMQVEVPQTLQSGGSDCEGAATTARESNGAKQLLNTIVLQCVLSELGIFTVKSTVCWLNFVF